MFIIAAACVLLPISASAAQITLSPHLVTTETGRFGKFTASVHSGVIVLHRSTCFSVSGATSPRDILKVTAMDKNSSRYTLSFRAQKAGNCEVTFSSGADSATLEVTVQNAE